MWDSICKWWAVMHSREGGYLVRRYISFLGHVVAMIVIMKLTWMNQLTENYFMIYVSFIAGHASIEKLVAHKYKEPGPSEQDAKS